MEQSTLSYDAFISYRHSPLDMFVAETIHKRLEEFKLPKNISQNRGENDKTKIERIFRDRDELPLTSNLSDQIYLALHNSEFLIVICSPRIKESMWCRQEMNKFIELHGHDKILAVLIEGEPEDSFPDEIIFKTVKETDACGNVIEKKISIEPLAADVRGKNKTEIRKKINEEILRLAAPMFHVNYDDLKQRHRERKIKKIASITSVAAGFFLAFGLYSGYQALTIRQKNVEIATQADSILQQNQEISSQAEKIQEQYDSISLREAKDYGLTSQEYWENCEPELAMKYAYMSVTADEDGNELPVTDQGIGALLSCTSAYETGYFLTPCRTENYDSQVVSMECSPHSEYLYTVTSRGDVYFYDVNTGLLIDSLREVRYGTTSQKTTMMLNEELFTYYSGYTATIYNFKEKRTVKEIEFDSMGALLYVVPIADSNQAVFQSEKCVLLIDLDTLDYEILADVDSDSSPVSADSFDRLIVKSFDSAYYATSIKKPVINGEPHELGVVIFSLETKEIDSVFPVDDYKYLSYASISKERFCVIGEKEIADAPYDFYSDSYFLCFDMIQKKVVWDVYIYGPSVLGYNKIYPSIKDDDCNEYIAYFSGTLFYMLDVDTGLVTYQENFKSTILSVIHYVGNSGFVVCTSDGHVYYLFADMRGYSSREVGLGDNLGFFRYFGARTFCVEQDGFTLKIWSYHKGLRTDNIPICDLTSARLSPDMERIYYYKSGRMYGVTKDGLTELWKIEDAANHLIVFSNDRIVAYDSNRKLLILEGKTGAVLYDSETDDSYTYIDVLNYDLLNNVVYVYLDDMELCRIDLETLEADQFFKRISEEYASKIYVSDNGKVIVLKDGWEDRLHVIQEGEETAVLDVHITNFMDCILFDEGKYFMIRYESEYYEVYDTCSGALLYKSKTAIGDLREIYQGTEEFPYIISTDWGTYFMNREFETFYRCRDLLIPVAGQNYFINVDIDNIRIFPFYDLNMLIEDVQTRMANPFHEDM